jgi:hypothetical protein
MRQDDTDLDSFDGSVDREIKISSSYVITPLNEISSRRFYHRNAAAAAYSPIKSISEQAPGIEESGMIRDVADKKDCHRIVIICLST